MGMMLADAAFDGGSPALATITAKMTELCGLSVIVTESKPDELHDLHAHIAFECMPELTVEICSYRAFAVRRFCSEAFAECAADLANVVEGANEPEGTQSVYLRADVGQEPTLFAVAELALEGLGGRPSDEIPDDWRRQYGKSITVSELEKRQRATARELRSTGVAAVLMLPVLIPIWIIDFVWFVLSMPFRIWRAYRAVNKDIGCQRKRHKEWPSRMA